jgi:hypothetical protein
VSGCYTAEPRDRKTSAPIPIAAAPAPPLPAFVATFFIGQRGFVALGGVLWRPEKITVATGVACRGARYRRGNSRGSWQRARALDP